MKYALILLAAVIILCVMDIILDFIKMQNTFKNHDIIMHAIHDYGLWCIEHNVKGEVIYSDMESIRDTHKRWKDWGYINILPKEKFEIIKPFIKEEKK